MSAEDEHGAPQQLSELIATRREKLARLREEGVDPFPVAFEGVTPVATLHERYAELEPGAETQDSYRVAGRLAARRGQGRAAFLDLVDRSGRIQLHARVDELGEEGLERLLSLDLGDLLGVDGSVFRSRRGELSLRVHDYALLAKSLRPPPDKYHGLTDVETRYRRRELDLIANADTRELFLLRTRIVAGVRRYLDSEGFIEVETPILQPLYGGALARPFTTHHNALDRTLYLRIATELYLKRLIVGGLERVYELGKDFRNEGLSPKHNPEFTVVEWYEAYADYRVEADRLEQLVRGLAAELRYEGPIDFASPWRRQTLREAIREHAGIDVLAQRDRRALAAELVRRGLINQDEQNETWARLVDTLLSRHVEPKLQQPTLLFDYPIGLSPFARAHRSEPGLAERFEAFAGGLEIANAFSELADPDEQRARFEAQAAERAAGEQETQPYDEGFVEALEQGMPPTGGLGLGIDRLVMLFSGRHSIREVVLFPALR